MPSGVSDRRAPVILVATANEEAGARHLRSLEYELRDIVAALDVGQREGICEVVTLSDATPDQVMRTFQNDLYRDRIAILHFAGHAGPEGLLFETASGSTSVADAGGLAAFLGCQRGLQLVVLNACATQSHVDALRSAGVGAVIATSRSVQDEIAHQFAVLLYQGLGSGAGIKRAYDEAAAGVRFKHGAIEQGSTAESMHASAEAVSLPVSGPRDAAGDSAGSRDLGGRAAVTTDDGRWPWDLYFRRGAEETVGPWALPEAAGNPLFGLPKLPETHELLTEPFRHLRPFARAHAELFFGRGKDIRELYDKVTSPASEPVILLYGATGVGKSSLLDAGLLPRLTGTHEVTYAARDRALKLLGTLMAAVGGDPSGALDAGRVAEAWRRHEAQCGRPLFVVIDQIEQAYTSEDAGHAVLGEAARELDTFASAIGSLFADDVTRPRGRLVLSFRKEWLSEVKGALEAHRVPRTEQRLEQLTRGGVLEAITGPTRVPQRRMPTRLELEPGLDVLIADDLLANRASHVAPLLQILLATMWSDAPRRGDVVRFDIALYQSVQAKAKQLDEFLTQQLDALRQWHAPAVSSGLALEFLRFYTTVKGTADEHSIDEETRRYPNANAPAPGLRAMCARLFLLVERTTDDAGTTLPERPARLAHDTLAPIIRERFDRSDLPGPRAKRILDGRSAEWRNGQIGTPLDAQDLGLVETGESGMRVWNEEETALVAASRVERDRARRRRAWVIRGAIAAVLLIAGFGVGSYILYGQSQERLAQSSSRELGARALTADPVRRDVGLLYAATAYEQAQTLEARRALFTHIARDPALVRFVATLGHDVVLSADGSRIFVPEPDGIHVTDITTGVDTLVANLPSDVELGVLVPDRSGTAYAVIVASDSIAHTATLGIWETATGKQLGRITLPAPDGPEHVAWVIGPPMANGRRVAAVADGNATVLWDVASATARLRLRGHTDTPSEMVFSTDGTVLVTRANDGRANAWDVATGKLLRTVRVPSSHLTAVAVSRDNSTIAVAWDDTLALWSIRTAGPPRRVTPVDCYHIAFTANDSAMVVSARGGAVRVFRNPLAPGPLNGDNRALTLHGAGDIPDAFSVSATGQRIAVTYSLVVHVWDLSDSTVIRRSALPVQRGEIRVLSQDGRLALTQADSVVTVWDVVAGRPVGGATFATPDSGGETFPEAAGIAAAGRFLVGPAFLPGALGPRDLYDAGTGRLVRRIAVPIESELAAEPTGARVAYGLPGRKAFVITDVATGATDTLDASRYIGPDSLPQFGPTAFSPRGDLLITQPALLSILVWDIARKELRDSLTDLPRIASKLLASEDGRVIAAVHGDEVQFYGRDRPSRGPSSRLRFPSEAIGVAMALSPNGQLFAYATEGTVTLVDVPSGETLGAIETEYGALAGLAFLDEGRALLALSPNGRIARIAADPEVWMARACAIASSAESFRRFAVDAPPRTPAPRRCQR